VLDADARIADVVPEARRHGSTDMHAFPVLDRGRFIGMVRASRLDEAAHEGDPERGIREFVVAVGETAPAAFPSVHPDQTVDIALQRMGLAGVRVLPVVSRTDASRLLGMVTLDDLPTAFAGRDGAPPAPRDGTPVKVLLTVVIAGVSGLFLLGVLLAQHYYSVRVESAAAAFRAGTALVAGGRDTEAVERFRSALSLDGRPDYRHALALALARSGRDAEALTYLSEVLRLSPDDGPANLAAARIARAAGETAHAADLYRRALAGSWPAGSIAGRRDATFESAELFAQEGDVRQAAGQLLQLAGTEKDPATLKRIGQRLLALDAPEQATQVFRQVTQGAPGDIEAHIGLGQTALARSDYRGARAEFQRVLALAPGSVEGQAGAALAEQVLSLDPTTRGLSSRDRYERAHALLVATVAVVESCPATSPPGEAAALAADAKRLLATNARRGAVGEATDLIVQCAMALWGQVAPDCPARAKADALVRVFARVEP
jgi:CBS domain-containing protein